MSGVLEAGSLCIGAKASYRNKLELEIDNCIPGMEVAESIFNKLGAIIISENAILDIPIIKLLKRLEFEKIKVYENSQNVCEESPVQVFKVKYVKNLQVITEVIQDLYMGRPLEIDKVNDIAESISEKANETGELIKNVNYTYQLGEYLYTHCVNVSIISMLIARWLGYSEDEIKMVVKAGLLHDIGKVKVDESILNKRGPLTADEFEEVKKHVTYGFDITQSVNGLNDDVLKGILMHHEREDGSGYVSGLHSHTIHEYAKIIAVADIFDAMSSDRVYQKSESSFNIFDQMETNIIGNVDKRIAMTFLQHAPNFFIGERFFLNNNEVGEIVFINPNRVAKPIIKIGNRYVDLSKESKIKIGSMM